MGQGPPENVATEVDQHGWVIDQMTGVWRWIGRIAAWVLTPVIAGFVLLIVGITLPNGLAAATGHGLRGTFVELSRSCNRNGCSTYGRFSSDDGTVVAGWVVFDEAPRTFVQGRQVEVLYEGNADPVAVYPVHGSIEWLLIAGFGLLALVVLVTWTIALIARVRGRRAPKWVRRLQPTTRR